MWRCTICKTKSGNRAELESQRCKGDPRPKWAEEAVDPQRAAAAGKLARLEMDESSTDDEAGVAAASQPHIPVWSGDLIFCTVCGAYAENKAVKLKGNCSGKPKFDGSYGGAWGQHRKLVVRGVHPRTKENLPSPVRLDGSLWRPGVGVYLNLKSTIPEDVDDKFYRYTPAAPRVMVPQLRERSVQQLAADRLSMVRKRQNEGVGGDNEHAENSAKRRRLRFKGPAYRG